MRNDVPYHWGIPSLAGMPYGLADFLALLDYASTELMKSKFVRPSVASNISEVIAWISFKFD